MPGQVASAGLDVWEGCPCRQPEQYRDKREGQQRDGIHADTASYRLLTLGAEGLLDEPGRHHEVGARQQQQREAGAGTGREQRIEVISRQVRQL